MFLPLMALASNASSSFIFSTKLCLPQIFSCHVTYLKVKVAIIGHLELDPSCKSQKVKYEKSTVIQIAKAVVKYTKTKSLNFNFPNQTFGVGI
jgi:hypothetical protein